MESGDYDRQRLAMFCQELPRLQDIARSEDWEIGLVEDLEAAQRGLANGWSVLVARWDSLGIVTDSRSGLATLPYLESPPPKGAYVCPRSICGAHVSREPSGNIPRCNIFSALLKFEGKF